MAAVWDCIRACVSGPRELPGLRPAVSRVLAAGELGKRGDALEEVEAVPDAAQKPDEGVFLPTVRKTLRTLRGFADELKSVPAIATQFAGYVEQIGNLITG